MTIYEIKYDIAHIQKHNIRKKIEDAICTSTDQIGCHQL